MERNNWFLVMLNSDLKDIYQNLRYINKFTNETFNNNYFWSQYLKERFYLDLKSDAKLCYKDIALIIDQLLNIFFELGYEYVSVEGFKLFVENNFSDYRDQIIDLTEESIIYTDSPVATMLTFKKINAQMSNRDIKLPRMEVAFYSDERLLHDLASLMLKKSLLFDTNHRIHLYRYNDNFENVVVKHNSSSNGEDSDHPNVYTIWNGMMEVSQKLEPRPV